jgi:predicted dithiol-disulfide oxidoreductase (DUF899 family)
MHIVATCDKDQVFETYWTTRRGAEAMDSYRLLDLTVHGRQETWGTRRRLATTRPWLRKAPG